MDNNSINQSDNFNNSQNQSDNKKIAIVTGGASGIGLHVSQKLKADGFDVYIADVTVTDDQLIEGMQCRKCDITNPDDVNKVFAEFEHVDVLVNNAGINMPRMLVDVAGDHPQFEIDSDAFDKMFAVNLKGAFLCAQACARKMIKDKKGVIINMSSESGKEGSQGQSVYAATKGAMDAATRSWAKELGKYNIRVVGLAPGIIETTGLRTPAYEEALAYTRGCKPSELSTDYTKVIPLGRDGKLDEIGDLVAYLASDKASYISGTVINISGGKSRG